MRATEIFYYFDGGDLAMPGIRRLRLGGQAATDCELCWITGALALSR